MRSRLPESDSETTVIKPSQGQQTLGVGTTLINGTYVIEEFLARGGMGEVYRAKHIDHDTQHAIKVILPEFANDEKILQLFIREARELGRVNSDAIVSIRDFCATNRLPMSGNGVRRGQIAESILMHRRLEPPEVVSLLERIGNGLATVHDIKSFTVIFLRRISLFRRADRLRQVDRFRDREIGRPHRSDADRHRFCRENFPSPRPSKQVCSAGSSMRDRIFTALASCSRRLRWGSARSSTMGTSPASVITARQTVPDLTALPASLRP